MIELSIPGHEKIQLNHLVCDVNGTLAVDGQLLFGVSHWLSILRDRLDIHLLTADTHGRQNAIDHTLNLIGVRLQPGNEAEQKAEFIRKLGAEQVISIGQGANDELMLKESRIGICIMSREGAAVKTMLAANVVVPDITAAFELLDKPLRLIATLRK